MQSIYGIHTFALPKSYTFLKSKKRKIISDPGVKSNIEIHFAYLHSIRKLLTTLRLALISPAVIKLLSINSVCVLEIKELGWLSLSCAQAQPIKTLG